MSFRYTRPDSLPPVVKNLIFINALFFLATEFLFRDFGDFGLRGTFGLWPINNENFRPYQIFTHMFTHAGFMHILFNMFGLWMFGRILENVWGSKRFLLFYLICGVGAAACHLIMQYFRCEDLLHTIVTNPNNPEIVSKIGAAAPALGASGAIMGIFAAFGYLFPNTELYIMFIPVPVKAKWAMLGLAAIDLFGGVANISGDNVAHFAHLGGALTGFILVLIWNKTNRRRFY